MRTRRNGLFFGAIVVAATVALPVAWYLLSPLFITRAVDEPLPDGVAATPTLALAQVDQERPATATTMMVATVAANLAATQSMQAMEATAGMETAMALPTRMVAEPMPTDMPAEPAVLAQGAFYHVVHEGQGTVTIYALPDGSRVLRLDDFEVLNGPDLHVYLVPVDPVPYAVGVEIDGALDLGQLKGNVGSQNYPLGADIDLSLYQSVVIWCQPFRVPFIAAALQ